MTQVIRAELQLETVNGSSFWGCHNPGVIDEQTQTIRMIIGPGIGEGSNRRQVCEIERSHSDVGRWILFLDAGNCLCSSRLITDGERDRGVVFREGASSFESKARICTCDDDVASGEIGNIRFSPPRDNLCHTRQSIELGLGTHQGPGFPGP